MVAIRSKSLIRDAWIAQRIIPNYEAIAAQARNEAVVCIHCGELVHPSNLSKHMTLYHSQNAPISTQTAPTRNFRDTHMRIAVERLERTETGSRVVYDVIPMTRKQTKQNHNPHLLAWLERGKRTQPRGLAVEAAEELSKRVRETKGAAA